MSEKWTPHAHFKTYFLGKEREFALRLHEGYVHFWEPNCPRFQSAPEEWVWVVPEFFTLFKTTKSYLEKRFLRDFLYSNLAVSRFARRLHFFNGLHVVLAANDSNYVEAIRTPRQIFNGVRPETSVFRLKEHLMASDLWDKPQAHFQALIWRQRFANRSFAHSWRWKFDWSWMHLPDANHPTTSWDEDNATAVAKTLLRLEAEKIELEEKTLEVWPVVKGQKSDFQLVLHWQEENEAEHFRESLFPEVWETWFQFYEPANSVVLERNLPDLTAHEQIEMLVFLRDWLENVLDITPEEAEKLLNPNQII